jgi:uncharacterized SAM-binding protein YcdF (DUF218 family)
MEFALTKLFGGMLMPLPIILALLLAALILPVFTRNRFIPMGLLALGTGLLLIISVPFLSEKALFELENEYPVMSQVPDAEWIVVLGGGSRKGDNWPPAARLGESSLYRISEGARLAAMLPGSRLVTSGGCGSKQVSTARLMAETAAAWGIDRDRIIINSTPLNTEQEAGEVAKLVSPGDTIILVTSAFHMRRSVALFEGRGLSVVPAPTGHLVDPFPENRHIGHYLPQATNISYVERVFWERIGLIWAKLRGRA